MLNYYNVYNKINNNDKNYCKVPKYLQQNIHKIIVHLYHTDL